jgi:MFS family permease
MPDPSRSTASRAAASRPDGRAPRRLWRSWVAVAAGFAVLFVCTGVNLSFGILFKPILLELGGGRSILALAVTASLLVNALGQPLLGAVIDRVGPRRVILPSMALMALGTGLASLAQGPWRLILLYGAVAAIGYTGSGILPVSVHITRWFPGERGLVMAVAACGFSLGQLVFTQLATYATAGMGWRRTYVLLAALLLAFLAVIAGWLRDAPVRSAPSAAHASPTDARRSLDRRAALRTQAFWGLAAGLMGCGFTDFLLTTHLAAFATDLGLPPTVAANAFSLWAAANIVGILVAGMGAARIGARNAMIITYLLRAASLFLLFLVRDARQLYLFAVLFGATAFTTAPLSSTLIGELFGPAHQGLIFGAVNLFHHTAGALGSYAGGLAFDLTGSYRGIFLLSGFFVIGSAVATTLARTPRPP